MLEWNEYLRMFTGLLALVGPFNTIPLFLSYTENIPSQRKRIARVTGIAVACILSLSAVLGAQILAIFSISISSFQVAGGMLLTIIAFRMLEARDSRIKNTPEEDQEAIDSDSIAVVPLALPLIAGPGSISTTILFSQASDSFYHKIAMIVLCLIISLLIWISLHLAPQIVKRLSQTSINVISRVMGLILAAMAVEFIVGGVRILLPGLAS